MNRVVKRLQDGHSFILTASIEICFCNCCRTGKTPLIAIVVKASGFSTTTLMDHFAWYVKLCLYNTECRLKETRFVTYDCSRLAVLQQSDTVVIPRQKPFRNFWLLRLWVSKWKFIHRQYFWGVGGLSGPSLWSTCTTTLVQTPRYRTESFSWTVSLFVGCHGTASIRGRGHWCSW